MSRFITPSRIPYVLLSDRALPKEEQTTYFFRVMSVLANAEYADLLSWEPDPRDASKLIPKDYTQHKTELLRFTLVGWEGKGCPDFVADAKGRPTNATLDLIHWADAEELIQAANDIQIGADHPKV